MIVCNFILHFCPVLANIQDLEMVIFSRYPSRYNNMYPMHTIIPRRDMIWVISCGDYYLPEWKWMFSFTMLF